MNGRRLDPHTKHIVKQIGLGTFVIGLVALLLTGVWHGTRMSAVTISEVHIAEAETVQIEVIERAVWNVLDGDYINFIPRRFVWTYPKEEVVSVVSSFDRVHNVSVRRDGTVVYVTYDEFLPYALWCTDVDQDECFFMDREGFAFTKAPSLTGGRFNRYVHLNQAPEKGMYISDAVSLEVYEKLLELLAEKDWFVSQVEIDAAGDAFLQIVGGGELKVTSSVSAEETIANLETLLRADEFVDLAPGTFQYIDLRFGNKLFVNEELAVPEEETASTTAEAEEIE